MSTQEDSGISIAYQHNQQGYRLLELPPDILESLGTGHTATLKIKSNLPSAKNTGDSSSSSHAVLCTERQTFHLRQVQSSNSILLLKPTQAPSTTDKPALSIIACPKSTLELHPASTSVISYLERVLAKYYGPQDASEGFEPMDVSSDTFSRKQTKRRVFDDVPASEHECQQAWTALCVFEREGVAYRPAASALIGVWKVMHTTAAAEGIDLSGRFDLVILWERMEDDGYPKALVEAVLARLSSENATSNSGLISIDKLKCVPWVGVTMLQSRTFSQPQVEITRFLSEWREFVPEAWRPLAELGGITGHYYKPSPTTIEYRDNGTMTGMTGTSSTTPSSAEGSSTGRKWHEKFRNAAMP